MNKPIAGDELNPAAAQAFARVRRLMVISLLVTVVAIAVVLMVIGYRVFRGEGSGASLTQAAAGAADQGGSTLKAEVKIAHRGIPSRRSSHD